MRTRTPYGKALGFLGQYKSHQGTASLNTAGLIAESQTGANVTVGEVFITNNTSATVLTNFFGNLYSTNSGIEEGTLVHIFMVDANTVVRSNTTANFPIKLQTPEFGGVAGSRLGLIFSNGTWYEYDRSAPSVASNAIQSIAGLTGGSGGYITADRPVVAFNTTGTYLTISAISGGYDGESISVVDMSSSGQSVWLTAGANLIIAGTGAFLMAKSAAYSFVRVGSNWSLDAKAY